MKARCPVWTVRIVSPHEILCAQAAGPENLFVNYLSRIHREEVRSSHSVCKLHISPSLSVKTTWKIAVVVVVLAGFRLCVEGRGSSADQPFGSDLPAQLHQEDPVPPGASGAFLETLRLQ